MNFEFVLPLLPKSGYIHAYINKASILTTSTSSLLVNEELHIYAVCL